MDRKQLAADASANPKVWVAGYDASNAGKPASACPYGPSNERMMNVWLSGHVTATDEREQESAIASPRVIVTQITRR